MPNNSWAADAESTRQTPVEEAKAIIFREGMNQIPNGTQIYSSDSKQILMNILFDDNSIFGTGDWVWEVYSRGLDSGLPFDFPDGIDPGNDWTLHLTFEVYEPVVVELAY